MYAIRSYYAMVSVCPGKENDFSFYEHQTATKEVGIENLSTPEIEAASDRIFCFGSISTIMSPAKESWIKFAKSRHDNSLIFYDLNARPSISKDPEKYSRITSYNVCYTKLLRHGLLYHSISESSSFGVSA